LKYLVDANVLSEATKPRPAAAVIEWLRDHGQEMAVSPIILGELHFGILILPAGKRRTRLELWFAGGLKYLNVLPLDTDTSTVWAGLLAELKRKGKAMSVKDSLIAASARQHGLVIATRNVADFQHAGVTTLDPFS
jgi:predicted nucleic acid-binding protein